MNYLLLVQSVLPTLENGLAGIFLRLVQALHIVHNDLAVEAVLDPGGSLVQRSTFGGSPVIMAVTVTARHYEIRKMSSYSLGFSRRL